MAKVKLSNQEKVMSAFPNAVCSYSRGNKWYTIRGVRHGILIGQAKSFLGAWKDAAKTLHL